MRKNMVEIILDDVVERLVANVISIATKNINFEWGFKEKRDNSVRIWLIELRDVVSDVDNVLDKFRYDIFGQKIQIQNQMKNQVPSISFWNFDEVKTIKQKLDKYVNEVKGLCLKIVNPKISLHNIDSSLNDSAVIGREYGAISIWDILVDDALFLKLKSTFDSLTIPTLKRVLHIVQSFLKIVTLKRMN